MAQRRYGPTRGAGVTVIELEGEKTIEPAALGFVGYAGILEKGPVGELITATNKAQFLTKCGSYYNDSLLPDACLHYYDIAKGAGGILLRRVTDGNELQASTTLYARYGDLLTSMGTLKAHNGGRWGGKKQKYWGVVTSGGDIGETALTTGITTWQTNEWAGGYVELAEVANTQYKILANSAAGVISVEGDSTMSTDFGAGSDLNYYLVLDNEEKAVSYTIHDGEDNPDTEFGLSIFIDGNFWKKYPNLSTDSTSVRHWVDVINNDTSNFAVEAASTWVGAHTPAVRPANHYGKITAVTATLLTAEIADYNITVSPGVADATFALGTTTDTHVAQTITCTMSGAGAFDAVSSVFGALTPAGATDALYTADCKFVPPFTVTEGGTPLATSDVFVINYKPFIADSLIDGRLYPDKPNSKLESYRIVDNDHKTITVAPGSDLTTSGAIDDYFLVEAALELAGGRDGIADLVDADYIQQAWDVDTSVFNRVMGRNLGLIKFAMPGVTATAVQKAGVAYAEAKNHQFRYESFHTTEDSLLTYINETLGRSDFAVTTMPSYAWVIDPDDTGDGKRKNVTTTGMIHGREARIAADHEGYHKAEAGIDATLPAILELETGDAILDEEKLNPAGISVIKKVRNNFILWGSRTLHTDPNWKWKHQREQMSYYEHVLQENFDWIIFAINDPIERNRALATLQLYFYPEWTKRALRGDTFKDAAIFKIDDENNTNATMAAGDMNAEILLRLADTVERFKISMGKQGIFESVA